MNFEIIKNILDITTYLPFSFLFKFFEDTMSHHPIIYAIFNYAVLYSFIGSIILNFYYRSKLKKLSLPPHKKYKKIDGFFRTEDGDPICPKCEIPLSDTLIEMNGIRYEAYGCCFCEKKWGKQPIQVPSLTVKETTQS